MSALLKELTESRADVRFDEGRQVELKGLDGSRMALAWPGHDAEVEMHNAQ